jgi:hypothetical protein
MGLFTGNGGVYTLSQSEAHEEGDMQLKPRTAVRFTGLAALCLAGAAWAQDSTTTISFPMAGIGRDQTVQLNLVLLNPCTAQAVISDSNGSPLTFLRFEFQLVGVSTVQWNGNQAPTEKAFPQRSELRAVITLTPPAGATAPCQAVASEEIYDNLIKSTSVIVSPVLQPPGPPQFGPVGVGDLQTVRLNVVAHPPDPCFGALSFLDASGNPIGSVNTASLSDGQAAYLDLTGQMATGGLGRHAEVVPVFTPTAGVASVCDASVEVYDQLTGWTRILVPPGPPAIL